MRESSSVQFLKIYKTSPANIILHGERLNFFPLKLKTRQRCAFSLILLNIELEVIASGIKQEKEVKGVQDREEEIKLFLFADNMMVYVENLKESIK